MHVDFPFRSTRAAAPPRRPDDEHVRDLVEQVLFTAPGRAGQPPGLRQRPAAAGVRAGDADELAAATQLLVQGALQQWLGDLIEVARGRGHAATERAASSRSPTRCARTGERRERRFRRVVREHHAALLPAATRAATACARSPSPGRTNGIDWVEVLPTRQRALLVRCSRSWPPTSGPPRCGSTAACASRSPSRTPFRADRRCRRAHRGRQGRRRRAERPGQALRRSSSAPTRRATSRTTRCASSPRRRRAHRRPPASTRCCRRSSFSFKVDCPSDFDCRAPAQCPPDESARTARSTTSPRTTRASAG